MNRKANFILATLLFPAQVAITGQATPATPLPPAGQPVVPADPILTAAENLVGEALFLRGFYAANDLSYDANGRVEGSPKSTDWTLAAVNVLKAERQGPDQIELEGVRAAIRYNPDAHEFQRHPIADEKVKLFIKLAPAPPDIVKVQGGPAAGSQPAAASAALPDAAHQLADPARQFRAAIAAIFAIGIDPALQHSMPPLWSHFFDPNQPWAPDALTGQVIYTINGAPPPTQPQVTAPLLVHRVDSHFTDSAARDKVRGQVQLRVVVDAHGLPQHIVVAHPLGYGLDQQATEAVAKWRFEPALLAGKPVPSAIVINMDFEPAPGR